MRTAPNTLSDAARLLTILRQTGEEINRLEGEAKKLLYELGDNMGYRDRMRQKAILLSSLSEETAHLVNLPPQISALTQERVGSFSFEAERALRVDSVFYMAVLLCPEDHKDGMPNELDNFIAQLHQELASPLPRQ